MCYTRNLLIFLFISTILAVVVYRFMPVHVTPLMVTRNVRQLASEDKPTWRHTWVSFDKVSPHLSMTAIASEDDRLTERSGFSSVEVEKMIEENKKRKRECGVSTISQQTAKDVFLWP